MPSPVSYTHLDVYKRQKEGFWIADFYTDHCGPCKILDVVLGQIIYDNPEINLAKCDIEKSPAYTERFGIQGTPTPVSYTHLDVYKRQE